MRLRLRLLLSFFLAFLRPKLGLLDTGIFFIRVLPNDLDVFRVSSDRYISYLDLARNDLAIRNGVAKAIRQTKAVPLARMVTLRYRYAARLFDRLEIRSRIACWGDSHAWFEQEIFRSGRSILVAYFKLELRSKEVAVTAVQVLQLAGAGGLASPPPPQAVYLLEQQEDTVRAMQHERESAA